VTILVVDDEELIIDVTKNILSKLGHSVETARNGHEAIAIYEKNREKIDLVLLDVIMPGMGGGTTFDHLKTLNPDIKVILASGYGLTGEAADIMKRGCHSFIQKPFRIRELTQKIHDALEPLPTMSSQYPSNN